MLEHLSKAIRNIIDKVSRSRIVDKQLLNSIIIDLQRALLMSDVNVNTVLQISENIREKFEKSKLPEGIDKRKYILKLIYDELINLLGGEYSEEFKIQTGKTNIFMFVGIQGSGKTTTVGKVAYMLKKRGLKVGIVCADTFRPAALQQLRQLVKEYNIPVYGEEGGEDAVKIALNGIEHFRKQGVDVILIDTSGRHKEEKGLLEEMKKLASAVNPTEIILVIDASIGQQAYSQAKAFHEATPIGSIIVTKLDGTAKGGGCLSAVAATGARIKYIGTGERIWDLEKFNPPSFVRRITGMGDLRELSRKLEELLKEKELEEMKVDTSKILKGDFTIEEMVKYLESIRKFGRLKKIVSMLPFGHSVPDEILEKTEEDIGKWKYIIQSMTKEEKKHPEIVKRSRIARIARGAGVSEEDVKKLLNQYSLMKKMIKRLRKSRLRKMGLFKMIEGYGY